MEAINSRVYNGFDVLKIVLAIMVTIIHFKPLADYNEQISFMMAHGYARIAVPTFFAISGFLLAECLTKEKIKKQVVRVWIIYAAWTVCYLPLIIENIGTDIRYENVNLIIKLVVFVRRFFLVASWTPLWYLLACCYCIPIVYWISKHVKIEKAIVFALIIYLCFAGAKDCYSWIGRKFIDSISILNFIDTWLFKIGTIWTGVSVGVLFMLLGIYINRNKHKYNGKVRYAVIGLILAILLLRYEVLWHQMHGIKAMSMMISLIPCVYCIIVSCVSINLKKSSVYKWLRDASIMIYGLHSLVAYYLPTLDDSVWNYFLIMFVTILITVFLLWLSKKKCFRWLKWLY